MSSSTINPSSLFASPHFDPNDYANAVLAGEPYLPSPDQPTRPSAHDPPPKEEISVAISKLSIAIEDVSKQIKTLVATQHEDLLSQAAGANNLAGSLAPVRGGLDDLESSLEKLRLKIRVPFQSLKAHVSCQQKLHQASDALRRTSRFAVLARRLQVQMAEMNSTTTAETDRETIRSAPNTDEQDTEGEKERIIAKSALSIAELVALLDSPINLSVPSDERSRLETSLPEEDTRLVVSLRSINAVAAYVPFIEEARTTVTNEMESMVMTGLATLNQSLLASSLQTAYNLRVLSVLIQKLLHDLSQAVEERIRSAFDLSKISKDALAKDPISSPSHQSPTIYRSRVRTEPTNITAPQFTAALWTRLEVMIEEMADCCVKVYTLERVLRMKKDTVTQVVFLDEAMKLLENKPSATFWTSLGRSLEKHARDSAKGSTFLQQTLSTGYPRLLRLLHEFFAKIAVHTDTVYTQDNQSPETVLILRALSNFEALYLSRSSGRLNEAVAQVFSGGVRAPPGYHDGINLARTIANELDSARFDPLLVKSVAKNALSSLVMVLSRSDAMVVKDRSAVTLIGPLATPQQTSNAQLATFLYHCWFRLERLRDEYSEAVFGIMDPTLQVLHQAYDRLMEPIMTAIRRELGAIIDKLHRVDLDRVVDPAPGMGGPSFYLKDLVEKLSFIKTEVLSKYNLGDAGRSWVVSIVKFVIRTFVLHVSIARPLGEGGKLQLTNDMTELEFALSAFMAENSQSKRSSDLETIGDDYRALRALRPLLFLENAQLAVPDQTSGLSPLIVLHHILVRSPLPLPHNLHGWQEAEYVRWVEEHSDKEAWSLIEGGLSHWEKVSESEGRDDKEYIELARKVISR